MKKKLIKTLALSAALGVAIPIAAQADSNVKMMTPNITMAKSQVIAGAKLFANRCMACHSLSFMRYSFLHQNLGMSRAEIKKDIMLPANAIYLRHMISPMPPEKGHKWFGVTPPNLSQFERYKGADFVYTYLMSFYWDPNTKTGWNNKVFPKVAMPWIMAPWQGIIAKNGDVLVKGQWSQQEFKQKMTDVVAFLKYVSDPSYYVRHRLGPWAIGILLVFTFIAYLVKREYWKDVQ